jgi:hypothetical protein
MIRDITIPVKLCECNLCAYSWLSLALKPPESCRNRHCRSREWNGKKRVSHIDEIKLPPPRKAGRPKTITMFDGDEEI